MIERSKLDHLAHTSMIHCAIARLGYANRKCRRVILQPDRDLHQPAGNLTIIDPLIGQDSGIRIPCMRIRTIHKCMDVGPELF